MFHYDADGLTLPLRIAGHPAVELCNTRAAWGSAAPKEYLHTYDHVAVWARENGHVDADATMAARTAAIAAPRRATALLARVIRFRDALYAVAVNGPALPASPAWWDVLTSEVAATGTAVRLRPSSDTTYASWSVGGDDALLVPVAALVWSAARLLAEAPAGSVRACPGHGCGWAFYDPRGRRRWCQMAWCGNRTKVRRHTERARAGESGQPPR